MALTHGARPRQLHWYHAGPMLFGDWGTSRLYVLGLALSYTGHASIWFMLAMSVLLVSVGWAYQVICRLYPDGGGVYSSAMQRSRTLAVIGALLLCADYIVTASLSALDAFHYLHLPRPEIWAAAGIALIGIINFFGPTKAGMLALVVALATVALSSAIGLAAAPHVASAHVEPPVGHFGTWWGQFTALILAISGVEAVANMTGIMVKPVERTSKWSIGPVLAEIVILNLLLTLAMLAVPHDVLGDGDPSRAFDAHRDTMLRLLAEYYIGPTFAAIASLVFAALLLSAVNTAVTDLVSIQYMMSRDSELPPVFGGLNRFGMPFVPLILGTLAPLVTVLLVPDVAHLADLYAIGVVGAVAVNLGSCSTNWKAALGPKERTAMIALAGLMVAIWLTIAWEKPHALFFAGTVLAAGLAARWAAHNRSRIGEWLLAPVETPLQVKPILEAAPAGPPVEVLSSPLARAAAVAEKTARAAPRLLVATRGNPKLMEFALHEAKSVGGELLVLYVRHVAVPAAIGARASDAGQDAEAQAMFADAERLAKEHGVHVIPLYAAAYDIAEAILDITATHGVDTLILGASQRGAVWKTMKGDVIQYIAEYLPDRTNLLIRG